eukprot:Skav220915  [mRNA]  locus=scaffold1145:103325:112842:+ [translate_table: standard]
MAQPFIAPHALLSSGQLASQGATTRTPASSRCEVLRCSLPVACLVPVAMHARGRARTARRAAPSRAQLLRATLPPMAAPLASQLWAADAGASAPAPDLAGRFAVVTGANRGIGKGVAVALGEAKATVFVTGRNRSWGGMGREVVGRSGLESTAELVTRAGGHGVPILCDHSGRPSEGDHSSEPLQLTVISSCLTRKTRW